MKVIFKHIDGTEKPYEIGDEEEGEVEEITIATLKRRVYPNQTLRMIQGGRVLDDELKVHEIGFQEN